MELSAHALQQIFVVSGLTLCSISDGFIIGQMSGMINALRDPNDSMQLTQDDISTIAAIINMTCFFGFIAIMGLSEHFGRRKPLTVISIPVILSWLLVYFAQEKTFLLVSRVIVGLAIGGVLSITYINIGEYVAPNMRSLSLNIMSGIGTTIGTMIGHILCLFMHWRKVALIGLVPTALSAIMPLFWVESPSWLATQQKWDKCEKAFFTLRGRSEETENELKLLLESQSNNGWASDPSKNFRIMLRKYFNACKKKYYLKIVLLMMTVSVYRVAAGRILLNTLAITIIQDITGAKNILQFMLMVDGFALIGSGLSCVFVSRFNMRPLLLISGSLSNVIQVLLAISLYVWQDNQMAWVKISLLSLYYVTITAGPYSVLETLLTEVHPLEIKAINCCLCGGVASVIQFISVQFATKMFSTIGYYGVFFLNSAIVFLCLIYMYFMLPETKGRTLQEIEYYFENKTYKNDMNDVADENKTLTTVES